MKMIKQNSKNKTEKESTLTDDLYIIATPIGNMGDITFRAIEVLKSVDAVLCEDTRTSGKLLSYYGINTPRIAYHEHNEREMSRKIISMIKDEGKKLALISDAGTPLISDPGYRLLQECAENDISFTCVPGACACIDALVLSALPTDKFLFAGFLPNKSSARKTALKEVEGITSTIIFYETANRLLESLKDIREVLGERTMAVARELTKKFEEARRDNVSELIDFYEKNGDPKGEIVLVIEGAEKDKIKFSPQEIDKMILHEIKTKSIKDAAAFVAEQTGASKRDIYQRALELKDK